MLPSQKVRDVSFSNSRLPVYLSASLACVYGEIMNRLAIAFSCRLKSEGSFIQFIMMAFAQTAMPIYCEQNVHSLLLYALWACGCLYIFLILPFLSGEAI